MVRGIVLAALAGSLLGCGPARVPLSIAEPAYRVVDLMPRYFAFRDSTAGAAPDERARRFRAMVIAPEARFYDQVLGVPDDARLARYLAAVERFDPVMRRVTPELTAEIPLAWDRMRGLFPDLAPGVAIYVVPSLNNSNGQVRYLDDSLVVMLGPDVHAYVEVVIDSGRRTAPGLVLDHELAHYHHWRVNPEVARAAKSFFRPGAYSALYYNLWSEGFATYVARTLNPGLPLKAVLGPGPDPSDGPRVLPGLAREFGAKLESTAEDDVRDLFYLSGRRQDIPFRSAYYVGYLVAERLARGRSLADLARLGGAELKESIRDALAALAAPASTNR